MAANPGAIRLAQHPPAYSSGAEHSSPSHTTVRQRACTLLRSTPRAPRTPHSRGQAPVQQEGEVAGRQAGINHVLLGVEALDEHWLEGGPGGDAQPHPPSAPAAGAAKQRAQVGL